ncbi:MAG: hypothetical protein NTY38_33775, partial [Acidobacteria bacterium]|nr:hypothetical protein [Acidobacteriota bacterium]
MQRTSRDLAAVVERLRTIAAETGRIHQRSPEFPESERAMLLRGQAEQLAFADSEFEAALRDIEARLRAAGSPEHLARLHAFAAHYRSAMLAWKSGTLPASAPVRVDESDRVFHIRDRSSDWRPPVEQRRAGTPGRAAEGDGPVDADLAESRIVRITPAISAKAAELDRSPLRLYDFVRNNYEFEPYYGLMQNSQAVFESGRGNAYDLATLLIALLRAALNWVGAGDAQAALRILQEGGSALALENSVAMDHRWVEAWIDTGNGGSWVPFDPGFKRKQIIPTAPVPARPFDRLAFLGAGSMILASDAYLDQIRQYLRGNTAGVGISDAALDGAIIPVTTMAAPSGLPYGVRSLYRKVSEVEPEYHHRATLSVNRADGTKTYVQTTVSIPEISTGTLTISFGGATAADQRMIDEFGGLSSTPATLVYLVPQIRIDGRVVASGTDRMAVGTAVSASLGYLRPRSTTFAFQSTHSILAGENAAIGLSGNQVSDRFLASRVAAYLAEKDALVKGDTEHAVRNMLSIAALRYFHRSMAERRRLGGPLQLRYILNRAEEAATIASLSVTR